MTGTQAHQARASNSSGPLSLLPSTSELGEESKKSLGAQLADVIHTDERDGL